MPGSVVSATRWAEPSVSNFDQTRRAWGPSLGCPWARWGSFPPDPFPQAFPRYATGRRLGATQCSLEAGQTEKDGPQLPTNYSVQGLSALLLGPSPPSVRCCSPWQYSRPLCRVHQSTKGNRIITEVDLYQNPVRVGKRRRETGVSVSNTPRRPTCDRPKINTSPGCAHL